MEMVMGDEDGGTACVMLAIADSGAAGPTVINPPLNGVDIRVAEVTAGFVIKHVAFD